MGKKNPRHSPRRAAGPAPAASSETVDQRILQAAQEHLFAYGYSSFTMDDLAHEVGISKKTLYVRFASKEAMVDRIVDGLTKALRCQLEAITTAGDLSFIQKLAAMIAAIGSTLKLITPHLLRDLQRFAPGTYQKIEDIRAKNIPLYFGRLIREGVAAGKVRKEVDANFATQFWLHAIRGLMQPAAMEQGHLTSEQTLEKGIDLFCRGLLSPEGRTDHENSRIALSKRA